MKNVNLKIAVLRKSRGFTQQELADRLGVSFQTVSKWENRVTMPDPCSDEQGDGQKRGG